MITINTWQRIVSEHHKVEIIDENTISIPLLDDIITRVYNDDKFEYKIDTYERGTNNIEYTTIEQSIFHYLNYGDECELYYGEDCQLYY